MAKRNNDHNSIDSVFIIIVSSPLRAQPSWRSTDQREWQNYTGISMSEIRIKQKGGIHFPFWWMDTTFIAPHLDQQVNKIIRYKFLHKTWKDVSSISERAYRYLMCVKAVVFGIILVQKVYFCDVHTAVYIYANDYILRCFLLSHIGAETKWCHFINVFQNSFFARTLYPSIQISLKYVPKRPVKNTVLVQIMACRQIGDKQIDETTMT